MLDIDTSKVSGIIRQVAATEIMPRYQHLQKDEVREKKADDPVTVADLASEKSLTEALTSYLPGSLVVGEEAVFSDIRVLERFKESAPVWVIDPIDGTKNFVSGEGRFGVLLALVQNNETIYGWVYDAIKDRMAVTQKGSGTYMDGNKLSFASPIPSSTKECSMSHNLSGSDGLFDGDFKSIGKLGCSVEFISDFLVRETDIIAGNGQLNTWDCASGFLAINEMGGYVRMNDGGQYKPNFHGRAFMMAAPNEDIYRQAHKIIYPHAVK